jgi:hypothetical protein
MAVKKSDIEKYGGVLRCLTATLPPLGIVVFCLFFLNQAFKLIIMAMGEGFEYLPSGY